MVLCHGNLSLGWSALCLCSLREPLKCTSKKELFRKLYIEALLSLTKAAIGTGLEGCTTPRGAASLYPSNCVFACSWRLSFRLHKHLHFRHAFGFECPHHAVQRFLRHAAVVPTRQKRAQTKQEQRLLGLLIPALRGKKQHSNRPSKPTLPQALDLFAHTEDGFTRAPHRCRHPHLKRKKISAPGNTR